MPPFVLNILLAFVLALLLSLLLVRPLGRRGPGPWGGLVFYAIVIFLVIWAVGLWATVPEPWAEAEWARWMVFVGVGVLLLLLIAALTPRRPPPHPSLETPPSEEVAARESSEAVGLAFGLFFWLLICILIVAIVLRHVTA